MAFSFAEKIEIRDKLAASKCAGCRHFSNFNNWSLSCKRHGISISTSGIVENALNFRKTVMDSKDFIFVENCDHQEKIAAVSGRTHQGRASDSNRDHYEQQRLSTRDNTFGNLSFGLFDGM
jgi:hypothetical protein